MKKIIVIAITAIVSLAIGVFIGAKMMTHRLDNDADKHVVKHASRSDKTVVKNINQTQSNDNWNVTLNRVKTEKVKRSAHDRDMFDVSSEIKDLLPEKFYKTTVEATLENKTDQDIRGSQLNGKYTFIDGNGNARSAAGETLDSYTNVRPAAIELFPAKSKTKVKFVVLSDKDDFKSDGIKIALPDVAKDGSQNESYTGGTFYFNK